MSATPDVGLAKEPADQVESEPARVLPGSASRRPGGQAQPARDVAVELLLEAGAVLASSLDLETTMAQITQLTVPRLADLCVLDLLEGEREIRKVAAAAHERRIGEQLEALRARYPVDAHSGHPVAKVIRSGRAELLPDMSSELLASFSQSPAHARFMIRNGYRSAVVAPLSARGRTLGALSLLRLGDCDPYTPDDLALGSELARRAALAIDNASLFSHLRNVEQRLEAILGNLAEAITVEDERGRTIFANQAAADLFGLSSPSELTSAAPGTIAPRFLILDEHGGELGLEDMPGRRLLAGERAEPLLVHHIVRATGEERWLMIRSSPISDPDSGRMLYAVNVFENITGVKRAQLAESFMAEASRTLASSMDYLETFQRIARLAVPQLADGCAVDVLSERGEIERVALHHLDPAKLALARQLSRSYSPARDGEVGVPAVIRTGRPSLFSDVQPDALARYARDEEHLRLLDAIGAKSILIVPLAAPARTIGALTLITSESKRRLTEDDVGLAVRLGRRAGTAVESARLYTERTRIAKVLEAALLPESLPQIPGIELAGLYRAAGELNDVGGDFYDVYPFGEDRWMLAIGDVCGKGPRAAGATALARHTLRTAAMLGQPPAGMLATLHQALRHQPLGADLCTVCLVTLERTDAGARVTVALAGHPPPLLIDGGGARRPVGRAGTALGVFDRLHIEEVQAELGLGETLLLYTDGLLEAGAADQQLGEELLFGSSIGGPQQPLRNMLEVLVATASARAGERLRDDIALVAVRPVAGAPAG